MARVNLGKAAGELYKTVAALDGQTKDRLKEAGFTEGFCNLLRLRASQINGCAYCCRLHTLDAAKTGESAERVAVLPAWRETGYFTNEERSALALTEAVTLVSDGQVPDSVYDEAARHLGEAQIAAVEWLAIVMNVWNRIAIPSRYPVAP
ncbi:MAG TPA: carboxymuconolactone decarboxylase family protein [Microbacteriaceae bacterium]|nr:carboxymuconolactone decarboxylase family protein [Microbacteriaceae bacterium]